MVNAGRIPVVIVPPIPYLRMCHVFACHIYVYNRDFPFSSVPGFATPHSDGMPLKDMHTGKKPGQNPKKFHSEPPHPAPELLRLKKLDLGLQFAHIFFIRLDSWDTWSSK